MSKARLRWWWFMAAATTAMFFVMLLYGFVFGYVGEYAKGAYFFCLALLLDRASDGYQAKLDNAMRGEASR